MVSRVTMRWSREGLRYAQMVQRDYGASAVSDVVMSRLRPIAASIQGIARANARTRLKVRSGRLGRSIEARARAFPKQFRLEVGVFSGKAVRYVGVQEFGTKGINSESPFETIRPKRAKALAMPVNAAVDARGVPRFRSPRTDPVPMTFIPHRDPGSNVVGMLIAKKDLQRWSRQKLAGLPPARWLLLRKVDLKPERFLRDAVAKVEPRMVADIQTALGQFLIRGRSAARRRAR